MGGTKSPYLESDSRLADVIAAIQSMGTYKFYKLDFAGWADRIVGDVDQADYWRTVFEEHPEFFRLDQSREKASLVWRRQHPKQFNVDTTTLITKQDFLALSSEEKERVSRTPLGESEIALLVNTAVELHSRALERKRDRRWWTAGAFGIIGVVVGALLPWLLQLIS